MNAQTNIGDWELRDLSPAERDVYELAREGKSPTAIAGETDREPTTVRTLLYRARRKRGESPRV